MTDRLSERRQQSEGGRTARYASAHSSASSVHRIAVEAHADPAPGTYGGRKRLVGADPLALLARAARRTRCGEFVGVMTDCPGNDFWSLMNQVGAEARSVTSGKATDVAQPRGQVSVHLTIVAGHWGRWARAAAGSVSCRVQRLMRRKSLATRVPQTWALAVAAG